jgi:hypothetical protein
MEPPVLPVQRVLLVLPVWRVLRALQAQPVPLARMVLTGLLVPRALMDILASMEQ